jgi:hypothetical protein
MAVILALLTLGGPVLLNLVTAQPPSPLEWVALGSVELVVAMFLWPSQFHYHFAAFLAPFLALAIALPFSRLLALGPAKYHVLAAATALAAVVLALFTLIQARSESHLTPVVGPSAIAAADKVIPPGACVLSDNAAMLLLANRFVSSVPGCGVIDDGLGTDLALSDGLTPATGAGTVPAVSRLWSEAFHRAQFVWFSDHSWRRVAFSPALLAYFQHDFRVISTDRFGDTLYGRVSPGTGRDGHARRQ